MTTQILSPAALPYGTLRLQVTTALGAFPVPAAVIEVCEGDNGTLLYRGISDENGVADGLTLPANPAVDSQSAATAHGSARRYTVTVRQINYVSQMHSVCIFADTKTILPVVLIPVLPRERRRE